MQDIYNKLKTAPDSQKGGLLQQAKQILFSSAGRTCDAAMAREVLELGLLHSLSPQQQDMAAFERYYSLLQPYYRSSDIPASQRMYTVIGLNLLRLLAENKIADFHSLLEELDLDVIANNIYIKHPIHIEQSLMEGSYNKVWNSRANVPAQEYAIFIDILMATIRYYYSPYTPRNEIASCCEKSYQVLKITDAATLLYFKTPEEVIAFAREHNWTVDSKKQSVSFEAFATKDQNTVIPSEKMIGLSFGYARELERIV